VLNHTINKSFGGINGPACMYSDVMGGDPVGSAWSGAKPSLETFMKLLSQPKRHEQYHKYGFWAQFDLYLQGAIMSPSYGQGYALQTMLLYDKLDLADIGLAYLAEATYQPPRAYPVTRECPYWFYERYQSPDYIDIEPYEEACGALNLVCVAEPLKVARLVVGVDDVSGSAVTIIPRIPPSWSGYAVKNWPILAGNDVVRADIEYNQTQCGCRLTLKSSSPIPHLVVKLGLPDSRETKEFHAVDEVDVSLQW